MIVTSNQPFSKWGEIFGVDMAATAMIDRLIHHSEILSLKGDSFRLRGKDLDTRIGAKPAEMADRSPSAPSPRPLERRTTRRSQPGGPPKGAKATIAASASPYGLGLATTVALGHQPSTGLVFDPGWFPAIVATGTGFTTLTER